MLFLPSLFRCDPVTLSFVLDLTGWHPYNPNAERDARIEAEGLYTDPIHQFTMFDEDDEDDEPQAPDFEL